MNNQRKSFVYYNDWAEQLLTLPDELRLKIDDAVKRFVLYGEEPTDEQVLYSMFGLMRTQLQRDEQRYEEVCAINRRNGQRGGLATATNRHQSQATATNRKRSGANQADNNNDNRNKNNNDKIDNNRATPQPQTAKRFSPPSVVEVEIYIKEMGYTNVDAQQFCDYYNSNGWMVGKNKMKSWQSAVRMWEHRADKQPQTKNNNYEYNTKGIGENTHLQIGPRNYGAHF